MRTSENITELATALSKAQSDMTGAKKSSKNPFFKSNYSDLAGVCEAISKPFSDNGLSYTQSPEFNENYITVVTRIMHSSGQWIEGTVQLPPTKNDAQGYGSAITYGRRYGLQAMAGVPSVDDDGQDAVKHVAKPKAKPQVDYTDIKTAMNDCTSMDELGKLWGGLDKAAHNELNDLKNEIKARLAT